MILRLLLFVALLSPLVRGSTLKMKAHCGDDEMFCMVSEKCANEKKADKATKLQEENECKAQVGIRLYSDKKALIRLRTEQKSIKFMHGDKELFGCELAGGSQVTQTTGLELLAGERWKKNGLECEFVYKADPLFAPSEDFHVKYGDLDMTVSSGIFGARTDYKFCDPDWLAEGLSASDEWLMSAADRRFNRVDCPLGELVYDDNGQVVEAASIVCVKESKAYKYAITPKAAPAAKFAVDGAATARKVGCRRLGCAHCGPVPDCQTEGCTPPVVEKEGDCNTLKCPSDRIQVNDRNATIGAAMCARHTDESGAVEFRWTFDGEVVEKVSCTETVNCQDVNPLALSNANANYEGLDLFQPIVACAEPGTIVVTPADPAINPLRTKEIKCFGETGKWLALNEGGETKGVFRRAVPAGSALYCEVPTTTEAPAAAASSTGPLAGAAVGALILIIVVIVVLCWLKRRRAKKNKSAVTAKSTSKKVHAPPSEPAAPKSSKSTKSEAAPPPPAPRPAPAAPAPKAEKKEEELKTCYETAPTGLLGANANKDPEAVAAYAKSVAAEAARAAAAAAAAAAAEQAEPRTAMLNLEPSPYDKQHEKGYVRPGSNEYKELMKKCVEAEKKRAEENPNMWPSQGELRMRSFEDSLTDHSVDIEKMLEEKEKRERKPKRKYKDHPVGPKRQELKLDDDDLENCPPVRIPDDDIVSDPKLLKPFTFPLNDKEKQIKRGAKAKQTDYPTMGDIASDWDDKEKGSKKKKKDGGAGMLTLTRATREASQRDSRKSVRSGELVTQKDTTDEQLKEDASKK